MKVTATSEFHGNLSVSFHGLKEGENIRKLRGPRSRYCLDYSHNNSHVCGCGYPLARTEWEIPEGWDLVDVSQAGPDWNGQITDYGRGYIRIVLAQRP